MDREDLIRQLRSKIDELSVSIEKLNLAEYLELYRNPSRLLYINFLAGIARGFGMAVGFTLLGALAIYILQRAVLLNLPLIGDFIAEIVRIVQEELSTK
ncbi:MAG: DUF5665 domain-containing protein [Bacillota bacterium]|nr:MAG: hypothetical protein DIU66_00665 [Bacillota bacterium]